MRWHKITAGLYRSGEWTACREDEPRRGHVWFVHHPKLITFFAASLREAAREIEASTSNQRTKEPV